MSSLSANVRVQAKFLIETSDLANKTISTAVDDDANEGRGAQRDANNHKDSRDAGRSKKGAPNVCFSFQKNGTCRLGDKCKYEHKAGEDSESVSRKEPEVGEKRSYDTCGRSACNNNENTEVPDAAIVGDDDKEEDIDEVDDVPLSSNPISNEPLSKNAIRKMKAELRPERSNRLCTSVTEGVACSFGSTCPFSHDSMALMSTKKPDLPGTCRQFDVFGFCYNGFTCRFANNHVKIVPQTPSVENSTNDPVGSAMTAVNLRRPESEGGVISRDDLTWNTLQRDVQSLLRKKKYNYKNFAANNIKTTLHSNEQDNIVRALATTPTSDHTHASATIFNHLPYPEKVRLVDFQNKVYIAPLTTLGNTPFRRVLKSFGADITCGEMAMAHNLEQGQSSEWALLKRHKEEDVYGVQIAGCNNDTLAHVAQLLEQHTRTDFIDLNCGCPIDVVTGRGAGSALMNRPKKIIDIVDVMTARFSRSMTVKIRTGWNDNDPTAHKIVPMLQHFNVFGNTGGNSVGAGAAAAAAIKEINQSGFTAIEPENALSREMRDSGRQPLSCVFIHGRSRQQRYKSLANWDYIAECAKAQNPNYPLLPVIGNGDIMTWQDWDNHRHLLRQSLEGDAEQMGLTSCAMIGRGALIKPWLPKEIHERQTYDISASERLDMLKLFVNYGYEHWGTDNQGIENTRRFLLEWLSYLHRYVPAGILEHDYAQRMIDRPPLYVGRSDTETLLSSSNSQDWIKISELLIGPVNPGFRFAEKHKSSAYNPADKQKAGAQVQG